MPNMTFKEAMREIRGDTQDVHRSLSYMEVSGFNQTQFKNWYHRENKGRTPKKILRAYRRRGTLDLTHIYNDDTRARRRAILTFQD